jgi:hypothetical protein
MENILILFIIFLKTFFLVEKKFFKIDSEYIFYIRDS